jgi:hypothetical protein
VKHAKKENLLRQSLPNRNRTPRVLERIHLDLVRPMQTKSYNKKRYMLNLANDYSRVMTREIATKDKAGYVTMEMINEYTHKEIQQSFLKNSY